MQMKYLSLALAAALATTLTACGGSDSKGNYNKDTLTTVDHGNQGGNTGNQGGNTGNQGGNTNDQGGNTGNQGGNTDQGEDNTDNNTDNNTDTDTDANTDTDQGGDGTELPGADPVINPGQAAYKGEALKDSSTVGQQYRRGSTADFDRPRNSSLSGNATVFGWQSLANKKLTNIVNGRETVELKAGSQSLRRYTGQDGKAPDVTDKWSLQTINSQSGALAAGTFSDITDATQLTIDDGDNVYAPQDIFTGVTLAGVPSAPLLNSAGHIFHEGGDITKVANHERDPEETPSRIGVGGEFADTRNNIDRNDWNNGLVKIANDGRSKKFDIVGQEDQIVKLAPDNDTVIDIVHYGQNTPTRIFGSYFSQNDKDHATFNKHFANSWALAPTAKAIEVVPNGLNDVYAKNPSLRKVQVATNTYNQVGKKSQIAVNGFDKLSSPDNTNLKGKYGLAATAIKLEDVQYGRVTSNLNALSRQDIETLLGGDIKEQAFFHAPYRNKFNYNLGEVLSTQPNDTVDTYYYRGLNETTLPQMAKLAKDAKYDYYGHAITYGIDNSFHGDGSVGGTNSFTYGTEKVGLGNFVTAQFDVGAKKVEGYVYNLWLDDVNERNVSVDKLINFSGDVVGNTVVNGKSNLAYGTKEEGGFKGSFYGEKANEFGGAANSVKEGYGTAKWGAVFGAQRIATGGNANQIE